MTGGYRVTIENTGSLRVAGLIRPTDGRSSVISFDDVTYAVLPLPRREVAPGETVTLHFALQPPAQEGRHRLQIDLVQRPGVRFSLQGVPLLTIDIEVEHAPHTPSAPSSALALEHNLWYYQPTQGIQHGHDGRSFPALHLEGQGCHVWDPEGREYIDYSMSWGATILGHAEDRIQEAIRGKLDSGALPPFPDPLEMEVSRMLVEDFPSAEMVVFGKNGSDVCTVAARLARLVTGKRVILSCGFHGWQDFALDYFTFADSGIPKGPDQVLHKFRFNDRADFFRLYNEHRRDLAAVMIEPAGPFTGPESGMGGDADRGFLEEIAEAARNAKALLIFDEIITGYRYRQGSVQKATGVVPDLTCLGKALASGMPLSALVGTIADLSQGFARTHYCPTFKGEVYSFAAAKAAIEIYRSEPVAEHIWRHGEALREGIHDLARDLRLAAECKGPPFRMGVHFPGADGAVARFKRTLFMQELLKGGVITVTGVMLPSYAHDEVIMRQTLEAIGSALEVVAGAAEPATTTAHRDSAALVAWRTSASGEFRPRPARAPEPASLHRRDLLLRLCQALLREVLAQALGPEAVFVFADDCRLAGVGVPEPYRPRRDHRRVESKVAIKAVAGEFGGEVSRRTEVDVPPHRSIDDERAGKEHVAGVPAEVARSPRRRPPARRAGRLPGR